MPRARKEYPDYPSHNQVHPDAYAHYRGRGRGYPNRQNYNNYRPPKYYGNQNHSMPHGQGYRFDGGWNSHQQYSDFNQPSYRREEWRPRQNEQSYRASYFPNPVLRTVYPSSFESGYKKSPNTRNCNESQAEFLDNKTDLQTLEKITPESQSKLDISMLDIPPMSNPKLKIDSDLHSTFGMKSSNSDSNIKTDQDNIKTTESQSLINVEISRDDLQQNMDLTMQKSDVMKSTDITHTTLQLALCTDSQVNLKVKVDFTAPKSLDNKMDIKPADPLHNFENKMAGLTNSEKLPLLDYIDLTDDGCETIKQAALPQPSYDATLLMATSNLHLQLPLNNGTEDQNGKKPLLTANAAIVQVAARGHDLEYTEASSDEYSPPPARSPVTHKKVTAPKKPVLKKTVIEDVDMRIGQIRMTTAATHLQMLEKTSTNGASPEKSSRSCLESDIAKEKKIVSPIIAKSKGKDPQLCSAMLASISSAFARKSKDGKKSDKIPSAKGSRDSVDAQPAEQAAAVAAQEETVCKEITAQKNKETEKKTLPTASSVVKSKHDSTPLRKTSSDTEKSHEKQPKKATTSKEKRRTSSSSMTDTADSIRHRSSPLPEKKSLGKNKESSGNGLSNTPDGIKFGNVEKDDGITDTMNKSTVAAAHCSSKRTKPDTPSRDDLPAAKASPSNESSNKHTSSKNDVEKNTTLLVKDSLVPPKDSRAAEEKSKSRKHHGSRKSSSDSEKAGYKSASSSSEQYEKPKKSYHKSTSVKDTFKINQTLAIKNDSNHELVRTTSAKYKKDVSKRKGTEDQLQQTPKKFKTATGQPALDSSAISSKKVNEKTRRAQKRSKPLTLDEKSKSLKKASSSEAGTHLVLEVNLSKPAAKLKKKPEEAVYKMTLEDWEKMGKPSIETVKGNKKRNLPLLPKPDVPYLSEAPEEKNLANNATTSDMERSVEQFNVCYTNISEVAEPVPLETPECETHNTGISSSNVEDSKNIIVRFQGSVVDISEAHTPVITIRDDEKVPETVSTGGHLTPTESSGVDMINSPSSDFNICNLKEEKELMIDDSNFLPDFNVKKEMNIDGDLDCGYFPAEDLEMKPHLAAPLSSARLLWPLQESGLNDFPGKVELTKLVEYFILLNQDLIKYNDSYRIASRLDETLRRVDERRATSDLLLVIKKVKPLIEELVNLTKVILKPDGDLAELIYNFKEILPSDALKLKADTLSRKAIADIFRLISEGNMDDIAFYQSSTVIVYNKEQGLSNVNLLTNIKPESMSQSYQSVIRNLSLEPIKQSVITQCVICGQKAEIPCGYCVDINVCSKSHLEEHCTNFHSMAKSYC